MSLWIYADEMPKESHFYYFKKKFNATAGDSLSVNICADTRYQLYINEKLICEGPCQGSERIRYYETADATSALIEGENEIFVKVLHVKDGNFTTVYRKPRPALWFDGNLSGKPLSSDASWECFRDDGITLAHAVGLHGSMPPFETLLADSVLTPVPVVNWFEPDVANHGVSVWGTFQGICMYARPIPHLKEAERRPMTAVKRGEGYIVYDTGEYTTAKVYFNVKAPKNSLIRITYAECVSFGEPNYCAAQGKKVRDDIDAEGVRVDGASDVIYASGEAQSFSPFWFRAFRYIKIEFPEGAEIDAPLFATYFYPLDEAGSFECSNERYNDMWHVSRNTLLCCTHEMYVDCPYYEQGQYVMDAGLEMLYTFRTSSDRLMPLKSLTDLAASQLSDGMICANYPAITTQVIPDFTLFWVLMARDYLRYTGDVANVKKHMGTIDKALEAFEILKDENGLIGPTSYWPFVDWVPGWLRGVPHNGRTAPLTVTCLMYAAALRAAGELCNTLGKKARAAEYTERAEEMIASVNKNCYDEAVGLYRDTPSGEFYSQHTTVWAVLSGAVKGDAAGELVDRTFNSTVKVEQCTFSMNYYLFRALEAAGRYSYAPKVFDGWEKMLDLHCTTWCENPDNPRSECHAWSSAPTYELSAMVLGVYPTADGYKSVRIQPNVSDLKVDWAKGTVPTPHGNIEVDWRKDGGIFTMNVSIPSTDICAEVILPDGRAEMLTGKASFECKI